MFKRFLLIGDCKQFNVPDTAARKALVEIVALLGDERLSTLGEKN